MYYREPGDYQFLRSANRNIRDSQSPLLVDREKVAAPPVN